MQNKYPIKVAARLSGLTPYVIRAWEKRHGVVDPERTDTNRRLYTNEEVELLRMLRRLTEAGYPIGSIAGMTPEELRTLLSAEELHSRLGGEPDGETEAQDEMRTELLDMARALDPVAMERLLVEGSVRFSHRALIEQVIVPFVQDVGRRWKNGTLRIAHEHVATTAVRNVLINLLYSTPAPEHALSAVVSTPQGQVHELGALISANIALLAGWDVTFLGSDLPAEEIAASARDLEASAVLLSIVFPPDDPHIRRELRDLAGMLRPGTCLIVGGHSAAGYRDTVAESGGRVLESMHDLWESLDNLRSASDGSRNCFGK